MPTTILLVGRTPSVIDDVIDHLESQDFNFLIGSTPKDVVDAFSKNSIDHVILGGGIDLDQRLEIVRSIFLSSNSTTVHMNSPSGPESFLPFVRSVLIGLASRA